jgi:hypothetical protein
VKEQGGRGFACKFEGSKGSQIIVSDVPNAQKWLAATKNAVSAGVAGRRHSVSIDGARGYYEPKRFDTSASVGIAFYVTYHGYFIGIGADRVANPRLAAQQTLEKVLKKI